MQSDRYQGRFPGYTGKKLFVVEHPVFGRCTVAAPAENAEAKSEPDESKKEE